MLRLIIVGYGPFWTPPPHPWAVQSPFAVIIKSYDIKTLKDIWDHLQPLPLSLEEVIREFQNFRGDSLNSCNMLLLKDRLLQCSNFSHTHNNMSQRFQSKMLLYVHKKKLQFLITGYFRQNFWRAPWLSFIYFPKAFSS